MINVLCFFREASTVFMKFFGICVGFFGNIEKFRCEFSDISALLLNFKTLLSIKIIIIRNNSKKKSREIVQIFLTYKN